MSVTDIRRYRKKPVEIYAARLESANAAMIERWCDGRIVYTPTGKFCGISIRTLEGTMTASPGDWIIRGVSGEFYPCKPDIFEQTYEVVDS